MSLKALFSEFKTSGLGPEEQKYFKLISLFSGDCYRPRDYSLGIHEIYFALVLVSAELRIYKQLPYLNSWPLLLQCNHLHKWQKYYIE